MTEPKKTRVDLLANQLAGLIRSAVKVPRVPVSDGEWRPSLHKCHENVDEWCERNTSYSPVRGWLFMDLRLASQEYGQPQKVDFIAHSVVTGPNGFEDITPAFDLRVDGGPDIYHFIKHPGTEVDFEKLVVGWQVARISYFPETQELRTSHV